MWTIPEAMRPGSSYCDLTRNDLHRLATDLAPPTAIAPRIEAAQRDHIVLAATSAEAPFRDNGKGAHEATAFDCASFEGDLFSVGPYPNRPEEGP